MFPKFPMHALAGLFLLAAPHAAANIFVTNTFNAGPGSLRDAILQANAFPGPDIICFAIPGPGPHTIQPTSALPALTDFFGTIIDGYTQPGSTPGVTPPATAVIMIEIDGQFAGAANGLLIQSDANIVQGLAINRFQLDGIKIEGGAFFPPTANFNLIYANYVGTDPSGSSDLGNGTNTSGLRGGIHVGNVAGGSADGNTIDRNLVSGNYADGVWIQGPFQPGTVSANFVTSNFVGTDRSGLVDLGNDHEGIALTEGTVANQILTNLVSGNDFDGIGLQGFSNEGFPQPPIQTSFNTIQGNTVGLDILGNPLPNLYHGITLGTYGPSTWGCADANSVLQNTIAFNGRDGICVFEDGVDNINADHNLISENSIHGNLGLGIDLDDNGVTRNNPLDLDDGANQELNYPVPTQATYAGGQVVIQGTLDIDTPPETALVEVFKAAPDPSGHGEGQVFVGATIPDSMGNWTLTTALLAPGEHVTATATDLAANTSEFGPTLRIRRVRAGLGDCTGCPTLLRSHP